MFYYLLIILAFYSCAPKGHVPVNKLNYGDVYVSTKKGVPFTGTAISKYENGQKEWEMPYVDGKEHGTGTGWYENGQKEWEIPYVDRDWETYTSP